MYAIRSYYVPASGWARYLGHGRRRTGAGTLRRHQRLYRHPDRVITSYSIHYTKLYEQENKSLENLSAIAAFKAGQVQTWLQARLGSVGIVMRNRAIVEQFAVAIQSQVKELPAPLRRITSYNVCYTKLLRRATPSSARLCHNWYSTAV